MVEAFEADPGHRCRARPRAPCSWPSRRAWRCPHWAGSNTRPLPTSRAD
jgi:hypothetical protein